MLNTGTNSVANPFQYEGGCFESSTGLVKFGTRYSNPRLGRWTQQDPKAGNLSNSDSLNPYLYAGEDPVNETDPNGAVTGNCGSSYYLFEEQGSVVGLTDSNGNGATPIGVHFRPPQASRQRWPYERR
ncbi:MAG TPA: RHS repeat-associated core domain-containing protein [Ktedonobacteraceae bacterium]|jgi:RHS repeat-associated protein|nr:RHS repeat-associated core domain-containing protein [Ktedonobacteraceae bacterium]